MLTLIPQEPTKIPHSPSRTDSRDSRHHLGNIGSH